ncbi:DUF2218 domain-containing protein [Epibacterium ulvae]|uniref:DUF2218 domain-containing protein n=1 Tax=Epibacterium ulvae TaxID=1156985 RepID=UPI001BFC8F36|nr:DUF2218 domain-containing protein [Epibacterium ulvae]MBT8155622.1 DUF2218 domain-containing protein [Epibacterium ulvae]
MSTLSNPSSLSDTGTFATPHAAKYLRQLCKHFAHKTEVTQDDSTPDAPTAAIRFDFGTAHLTTSADMFTAQVAATDTATLTKMRFVIDKHLERFAFREDFTTLTWQTPAS